MGRGVVCQRDSRSLCGESRFSGAIDAWSALLCALLLPGDGVVVEDPCFLSSINMVRYAGFTLCPVAVDAEGMDPDGLEECYATAHGR